LFIFHSLSIVGRLCNMTLVFKREMLTSIRCNITIESLISDKCPQIDGNDAFFGIIITDLLGLSIF
jgi:hypothetical protein